MNSSVNEPHDSSGIHSFQDAMNLAGCSFTDTMIGGVFVKIFNSFKVFKRYSYLLQQLVARDFKVKYKRSVLGVLWSVLNPLFMMIILSLVFANLFRMKDATIRDYPVYLLVGLVFFNYFSEATNLGMGAVVGNFNLITKVYMPKYIFPFSKVLSSGLNFLFSLIALYLIIFVEGYKNGITVTWVHIFLPLDMIYIMIFALGVSMFLAALTVFFRDMFYIYGVIITAWTYLTPVMYPISIVKSSKYAWWLLPLMKLNPLYHYIQYARTIVFGGMPSLQQNLICIFASLVTLLIGVLFFRSKQDKFIYYI
ncbi:MAG TPA: ABC transporter permease [Clostridia bacterium]|nr:ABC transporter permease [Clostridia bacterium]